MFVVLCICSVVCFSIAAFMLCVLVLLLSCCVSVVLCICSVVCFVVLCFCMVFCIVAMFAVLCIGELMRGFKVT